MIQEGKKGPSFEEKLETLEGLVARMEEGGLHLDELVRLYEEGMTSRGPEEGSGRCLRQGWRF